MPRMPCSITDGLQYDDWLEGPPQEEDEDEAYERYRQQEIDDASIAPNKTKELP